MNNTYIVVADGLAFVVMIVNNDSVGGRYQIVSLAYNGIKDFSYNSIADVEESFDRWVSNGVIESWYPLWNPGMTQLDVDGYTQKAKQIMRNK